jgi:hypothetical protein
MTLARQSGPSISEDQQIVSAQRDPAAKDPSYIQASERRTGNGISNGDTKLLETELSDRKQKTDTRCNQDETRLFHNAI